MTKSAFETAIAEALEGVELSSTSSNKFDRLIARLAKEWGVEPMNIAVKALGAPKNYGNRISEATRLEAELLILLSDAAVDHDSLGHIFGARALRPIPTLLAVRGDAGWTAELALLAPGVASPFPFDIDVLTVGVGHVVSISPDEEQSIAASIEGLERAAESDDVGALLAPFAQTELGLVVKRVPEAKNLANRVGEAVGRGARFVVLDTVPELADAAAHALRAMLSGRASGHVVWREEGRFRVRPVPSEASIMDATEGDLQTIDEDAPGGGAPETPATSPVAVAAPSAELEYRRLPRVKQLLHHLPLDAGADRLYEEHQDSSDRLSFETKTLQYVRELLGREERAFIVLTGNAGHGKTHMCRRLLEADGANTDVMERLGADTLGGMNWEVPGAALPIRIVKDLSEINPPERAAERLEGLIQQEHSHVVVCANEGRLRDVVGRSPTHLKPLLEALEAGLDSGATCPDDHPDVHVVNLNFQAATAGGGGFLGHVLDHFLNYESAWKVCESCAAQDVCPIRRNREILAMSPRRSTENQRHREVLIELVRVAEEGGYVLTYRETLVLVAYLITGGLSCAEVEKLHVRHRTEELERSGLLDLLFETRLPGDAADVLRILPRLRRMDPGAAALRPVDEAIHYDLEEGGALGRELFGDTSRQLYKKADIKFEQDAHRVRVRRARRASWFEAPAIDDSNVTRTERLGLRHYADFATLQRSPEPGAVISIIRRLVRGLHTIQGAVGVDSQSSLHLVDPAFGRSGSHAAVIARSLRVRDLELLSESEWWRLRRGQPPKVLDSVEWLDRRVVLVSRPESLPLLALDLHAFEFVMNAADGVVMRDFHSAERRRILRTLAKHAEKGRDADDEIRVLLARGEGRLTLERDHTILLERTS